MCLTCSTKKKKLVELADQLIVRGILGGKPLTFLWARERKYKAKSLALWTVLIQVSNETLLKRLKHKRGLDNSVNPDTFLHFLKSQATFQSFLKRLSLLKSEPSYRGPPKGFVPLPDAEIGGCARNDSLIAPAI